MNFPNGARYEGPTEQKRLDLKTEQLQEVEPRFAPAVDKQPAVRSKTLPIRLAARVAWAYPDTIDGGLRSWRQNSLRSLFLPHFGHDLLLK